MTGRPFFAKREVVIFSLPGDVVVGHIMLLFDVFHPYFILCIVIYVLYLIYLPNKVIGKIAS